MSVFAIKIQVVLLDVLVNRVMASNNERELDAHLGQLSYDTNQLQLMIDDARGDLYASQETIDGLHPE